jgi:hypothetical protein
MANGTTRLALSKIALRNGNGNEELAEEMKMDKGESKKIPLKNPTEHNHSN